MSIKDFLVLTKLGQGAYSSVYKVQRIADNQIYALKKVKLNNLSQKQQHNALNEVRILASIKCQHIISYKQSFIEGNLLCIVMEYADDGDLYQKIMMHKNNNTHFEQSSIWAALIQVAKGLKALHSMNILHRDLKSANVFLNKDGTAKLGDMNVSKIAKNGLVYTQTGTPYYASPQVWKEKPYNSKSDIWSLGCVIYEMATLKTPFRGEDMDALYKKIVKGIYAKLGDRFMLQTNPNIRPTAEQLLKSLQYKEVQLSLTTGHYKQSKLLQTIYFKKNEHQLTEHLPQSTYQQYDSKLQVERKDAQITIYQKYKHLDNINLPKLDQIIKHHKSTLNAKKKIKDIHSYLQKEDNEQLIHKKYSAFNKIYQPLVSNSLDKNKIYHLPNLK